MWTARPGADKGQLSALPLPTSRWIPQGNLLGNRWRCQRQKERDEILMLVSMDSDHLVQVLFTCTVNELQWKKVKETDGNLANVRHFSAEAG